MKETNYTLMVQGKRIPVSEAVYHAYYQCHEHARYLHRQSMQREASLEKLSASGMAVEAHLLETAEEKRRREEESALLHLALAALDPDLCEMLWQLVLGERTERALAAEKRVSKSAIHREKLRALRTLRRALAQEGYVRGGDCHDK